MKYISVCSGIEAATVAWKGLGWEAVAFAEIDNFPSAVLAHHYPNVPNLGDISKVDWRPYRGAVDLVVGGTPCQSFSVAGNRDGLDGASGLVREYFRLLDEVRPRWFVWENVPGAFTTSKGNDFKFILGQWDKLGYHVAWRVLDAQYFGVPQRRRRIFAVGHLGDWRSAAEVLFEPDCLQGNTKKSGKARKGSAAGSEAGAGEWPARVSSTLNASFGEKMGLENQHINQGAPLFVPVYCAPVAPTISASGPPYSGTGNERVETEALAVMAFQQNQLGEVRVGDVVGTLNTNSNPSGRNTPMIYCAPVAPTLTSSGACFSRTGMPNQQHDALVCMATQQGGMAVVQSIMAIQDAVTPKFSEEKAFTLTTPSPSGGGHPQAVLAPTLMRMRCGCEGGGKGALLSEDKSLTLACNNDQTLFDSDLSVRRLTPTECERLQGFPDDYTRIPYRNKPAEDCPDGPRYKALGNSMAVPCMRWIGERIAMVEKHEKT